MDDDDDTPPDMIIGHFDPIQEFTQTLNDLMRIVDMFQDTPAMSAQEFLHATNAAKDRMSALITITLAGVVAMGGDRVTMEDRMRFASEMDFAQMMETPEQKREKLLKYVRLFSHFQPGQEPPAA